MRILFLSRWFPIPVNNGSKLRIYNLLRGLAEHHDVTLLSFTDQPDASSDSPEMRSLCSDVYVVPWREFDPNSRRARGGILSLTPRFLLDTYSPQMATLIQNAVSLNKYDLVIASQLSMAAYSSYFHDIPAIFDEIELGIFYGKITNTNNSFQRFRHLLTWFKLRKYLSRILDFYCAGTVVSEKEHLLLLRYFPEHGEKISIIPNCINFDDYQGLDVQSISAQLIFTGSFRFNANFEAMSWFVREVFPKILEQMPEVQLVITGDHANLHLPPVPNITLTGYVDNIKSLVSSSRISLAPLLTGGGTRLKILEAMALGTPVVATSKGAEGLDVIPGEHLLIADTPDEFLDCVSALLKDDGLYKKLSVNGKLFVKENYNWNSIMPRFLCLVERIGSG